MNAPTHIYLNMCGKCVQVRPMYGTPEDAVNNKQKQGVK